MDTVQCSSVFCRLGVIDAVEPVAVQRSVVKAAIAADGSTPSGVSRRSGLGYGCGEPVSWTLIRSAR